MDDLKQEYPTVFDGRITAMEGEEFHISLTTDSNPFCVNTPRSVPFTYRGKLQAELDLLYRHIALLHRLWRPQSGVLP